jgi:hypothetical protein
LQLLTQLALASVFVFVFFAAALVEDRRIRMLTYADAC